MIRNLTRIIQMHDSLCDAVSLINRTFSFQILWIIVTAVIFNIFGLFSAYRWVWCSLSHEYMLNFLDTISLKIPLTYFRTIYNVDGRSESAIIAIMNNFWVMFYVNIVLYIISCSTWLTNTAKQTARIVHRHLNKNRDPAIQQKVKLVSS